MSPPPGLGGPPQMPGEEARAAAVDALALTGRPPEERFDRITRLASATLDAPISFISLVGSDRWWAVSRHGTDVRELPREHAMCSWAIADDQPTVVPDLRLDARFASNPLVASPEGLRFYAAKPISDAAGHRVGTLCVLDVRPRMLDADAMGRLSDLAALAELELNAAGLSAALEARREAARRLRSVIDSAREPILTADSAGRVEYFNPAAAALLGRSVEEAAGWPVRDLIVPTDGGPEGAGEVVRPSGERVPVEYGAAPLEHGDGGSVITFRDVSRRRAEERARQGFIATASHELRTPVTAILGYAEMLVEEDEEERLRGHAETIARNARRLGDLVGGLLATAELEARAEPADRAPVDLASVAATVIHTQAPSAAARGIRVEHVPRGGAHTRGDRRELERAADNLLGNAIKFAPEGSTVTVSSCRAGGDALLEVRDRGPGVPAQELPYLGRRFFRASNAAAVEGTGLGLAIAREIAERHGGHLEAESAEGAGSTFRLRLPVRGGGDRAALT